jgi:hypothetical protein
MALAGEDHRDIVPDIERQPPRRSATDANVLGPIPPRSNTATAVPDFLMDAHPVTNAEFRCFVGRAKSRFAAVKDLDTLAGLTETVATAGEETTRVGT